MTSTSWSSFPNGDEHGADLVASGATRFQPTSSRSRGRSRVASPIRFQSRSPRATIEPSAAVLCYDVALLYGASPKPEPDISNKAMASGVTRPVPFGVIKFTCNPATNVFQKAWLNYEIDNTDVMVPVILAESYLIYLSTKNERRLRLFTPSTGTPARRGRCGPSRASAFESLWRYPRAARRWRLADRRHLRSQARECRRGQLEPGSGAGRAAVRGLRLLAKSRTPASISEARVFQASCVG